MLIGIGESILVYHIDSCTVFVYLYIYYILINLLRSVYTDFTIKNSRACILNYYVEFLIPVE